MHLGNALVEPRRSLLFTVKTRMSRVRMSTPSRSAVGAAVQFRCVFYSCGLVLEVHIAISCKIHTPS